MIGSLISGLIGQSGANAAAGMAQGAGNQAEYYANNQKITNRSDASP